MSSVMRCGKGVMSDYVPNCWAIMRRTIHRSTKVPTMPRDGGPERIAHVAPRCFRSELPPSAGVWARVIVSV